MDSACCCVSRHAPRAYVVLSISSGRCIRFTSPQQHRVVDAAGCGAARPAAVWPDTTCGSLGASGRRRLQTHRGQRQHCCVAGTGAQRSRRCRRLAARALVLIVKPLGLCCYTTFFSSRNSRRRIFPTFVFGNSLRNSMYFGFLYAVNCSLQ